MTADCVAIKGRFSHFLSQWLRTGKSLKYFTMAGNLTGSMEKTDSSSGSGLFLKIVTINTVDNEIQSVDHRHET